VAKIEKIRSQTNTVTTYCNFIRAKISSRGTSSAQIGTLSSGWARIHWEVIARFISSSRSQSQIALHHVDAN
jgi:hypothetical protein